MLLRGNSAEPKNRRRGSGTGGVSAQPKAKAMPLQTGRHSGRATAISDTSVRRKLRGR